MPAFMPSLTPILPRSQRVRPFSTGLLTWPIALYKTDYKDIQRINGPDAYFFVRFLRVMIRVLVPIWIISWIVLLPVTSVNNSIPGNTGLSRFTLGNIAPNHKERYAAFIILVWLSTCESYVCESDADWVLNTICWSYVVWIYWNIKHEMTHFINVRQLHLINPVHSRSAQANTILISGIPSKYLSEKELSQLYSRFPGGVKKIWINRYDTLLECKVIYLHRIFAVI